MSYPRKLLPTIASFVALLKVGGAFLPLHHPSTPTAQTVQTLFTTTTIGNVRQQCRRNCRFQYLKPSLTPARLYGHHCGTYNRIRDLGRFHDVVRKGGGYSVVPLSAGRTKGQIVETDDTLEEKSENIKVKNDQEWQFFDTARINVKAGMGGNG